MLASRRASLRPLPTNSPRQSLSWPSCGPLESDSSSHCSSCDANNWPDGLHELLPWCKTSASLKGFLEHSRLNLLWLLLLEAGITNVGEALALSPDDLERLVPSRGLERRLVEAFDRLRLAQSLAQRLAADPSLQVADAARARQSLSADTHVAAMAMMVFPTSDYLAHKVHLRGSEPPRRDRSGAHLRTAASWPSALVYPAH